MAALDAGNKIVTVSIDNAINDCGWPPTLPDEISAIKKIQVSEVSTNALFEVSVEKLIEDRLLSAETDKPSEIPCGAVDLGLSVKWGSCNHGASRPEECGVYYAWGETETKADFSSDTYRWPIFKCWFDWLYAKYNSSDKFIGLELPDDVAHARLAGRWRMPTDAEWTEIREKCIWIWTNRNGVNGYKVTSKINGNSIFLPAAGGCNGISLYDAGSRGYYWSSSLNTSYPNNAWSIYFNSCSQDRANYARYNGFSVRPVLDVG